MREYRIDLPSGQTTVLLSDEDAAARGLTPAADETEVATKAHTPANKARKPSTKRAEAAAAAFRKGGDE